MIELPEDITYGELAAAYQRPLAPELADALLEALGVPAPPGPRPRI